MRTGFLLGLLLLALDAQAADQAQLERAAAAQALPALTQKLCDALAPGDKALWTHLLSERFEVIDESGAHMNKKQLMDGFSPLPPGLSGTIEVKHAQVADFGTFAIIRYDMDEHERVFDQALHVLYRATDTWRREHGAWRQVSQQVMVLAQDPLPLPVDTKRLDDYVGRYAVSGKWNYRVERHGDGLSLTREGHEAKTMIAVGDNVFVVQGDPLAIQYIFVRGADGKVQRIVERRKFADLDLVRTAEAAAP
ncbi:MAG TPA: DUF4440 domain-containing protein [Nevskia sp.]|nr:DUF4440 domain-containing protein [Nevskia sp.]